MLAHGHNEKLLASKYKIRVKNKHPLTKNLKE